MRPTPSLWLPTQPIISGETNPKERLGATLATRLYAVCQGAPMNRVHDVKAFRQELRTWEAIEAPNLR